MHLAYNFMQLGELRKARRLLEREWGVALAEAPSAKPLVLSAWAYLRKLRRFQRELRVGGGRESEEREGAGLRDAFYRQRFVAGGGGGAR